MKKAYGLETLLTVVTGQTEEYLYTNNEKSRKEIEKYLTSCYYSQPPEHPAVWVATRLIQG